MLSNLLLSSFPGRKHQAKGVLNNAGETSRSQSVDEDSTFQSQGLQLWNHKLARVHDQGAVLDLKSFSQSNLNVLSASGRTVSFAALSAETCNLFDAASLQQQLHGLFGQSRFAGVWAWDTLLHGAASTRECLLSWLSDHMLAGAPLHLISGKVGEGIPDGRYRVGDNGSVSWDQNVVLQESEQPKVLQHSAFTLERKFLLRQGPEEFVFVRK